MIRLVSPCALYTLTYNVIMALAMHHRRDSDLAASKNHLAMFDDPSPPLALRQPDHHNEELALTTANTLPWQQQAALNPLMLPPKQKRPSNPLASMRIAYKSPHKTIEAKPCKAINMATHLFKKKQKWAAYQRKPRCFCI